MTVAVDSLWSNVIKPTIQSPRSILETQARAIRDQTNGVLVGDLRTLDDENKKFTYLSLELVVPALDNYRHRVLLASHGPDRLYPAQIDAEFFQRMDRPRSSLLEEVGDLAAGRRRKPENEASSDEEFRTLVQKVLNSPQVISVAVSLIARANEVSATRDRACREAKIDLAAGDSPKGGLGA